MLGHYESDSTKSNIQYKQYKTKIFVHFAFTNVNLPTTNHFFFFREFKNDLNTISMSENKKARKTISFCNDFNLYTVIDI